MSLIPLSKIEETKTNVGELLVELATTLTMYTVTATAIVLLSLTWIS